MSFCLAMLIAMGIDAAIGWPDAVYRRIGHPVTWAGGLIATLEGRLNRGEGRRAKGVLTALIVIGLAGGLAWGVVALLPGGWFGTVLTGVLAWPLVALRSMHQHVAAVAAPLGRGDLAGARHAVSMIVGRDPAQLDSAGVARAAVESLAENTSDGIVAPLFWGVVAGLPGIAAYKAINTLDSMIGHRNARYEQFGWASAKIDDVVNLIPARLTGVVFALVSPRPGKALKTMARDARHHRSPNAGWPESAMAGALGIRLSGPRVYGDRVANEPWVNEGAPDPSARDVTRGLALYVRAMGVLAVMIAAGGVWGW
ncbi:adenosylcobinamide-phosphate synthase CbiB [Pararhodobacter zhoushanensis]|uniref:Cobalamin biosynthesis protein CobD n=1 Tax=Pararhodobacter zhoushanensis TaxID=2479545 RepID=A0ABT3GTW0_9RHOB|nr:adenosylcobinamide-phosphate synthase CbiB [Pararhodobacter zhoushanensis]MCW1930981.1 adenosylcobinamide-phosphate synthase CbiB [Pararhodobacter zhoushanensis]